MSSGLSFRASLTAVTFPVAGEYTPAAALHDSIAQASSPWVSCFPTGGNSTKVRSPRASLACWVMPTVAVSPSTFIHSCCSLYNRLLGMLIYWLQLGCSASTILVHGL